MWFRSNGVRRRKAGRDEGNDPSTTVILTKSHGRVEAQQAVAESAARHNMAQAQRGMVARVVAGLAEIRENNGFAEKIRVAMEGERS